MSVNNEVDIKHERSEVVRKIFNQVIDGLRSHSLDQDEEIYAEVQFTCPKIVEEFEKLVFKRGRAKGREEERKRLASITPEEFFRNYHDGTSIYDTDIAHGCYWIEKGLFKKIIKHLLTPQSTNTEATSLQKEVK